MRWVLKWTLIIFAALVLLHIITGGNNSPDTSNTQEAVKAPVDVDKALTECLLPKAQYGQYSSSDGGKSAEILLEKECTGEYAAWVEQCQKAGDTQENCVVKSAIIAQTAIKAFNK
jgi:hypothetical protein